MKKVFLFASAALLAGAPVMAQAVPAIAPADGEGISDTGAGIIAAVFVAGIVTIAIVAASSDDNAPVSA